MNIDESFALLLKEWGDFKNLPLKEIGVTLKFDYNNQLLKNKKKDISSALILWQFVLKHMSKHNWVVRREFLSSFLKDENPFIVLVATIEYLPTSVWRKILWKHNIDFMSFESFLRRIDKSQIKTIRENYYDLFSEHKVPRILNQSYRRSKKIDLWDLKTESFDFDERYKRKCAWSYNLLGLDFGFNAYPEGETDDTEAIGVNPLNFLSLKNHDNDFVVQQEMGGKYWWLYKKVRSNYVWKPDREVKLSTHICPGFWYTLIMHLWFWIVSPVMCAVAIKAIMGMGPAIPIWDWKTIITVLMTIVGALTPLWLLAAFIKFSFIRLIPPERDDAISEWLDTHREKFEKSAIALLLVIVFVGVSWLVYRAFVYLYPIYGVVSMSVIVAVAFIYIGYKIYFKIKRDRFPRFKEFPFYFQIPIAFVILSLAYRFTVMYKELILQVFELVFSSIVMFLVGLWSVIAPSWMYILTLSLPIILSVGFAFVLFVVPDKKQASVDRYIQRISKYLFILMSLLIAAVFFISLRQESALISNPHNKMISLFILGFSVLYLGVIWYLSFVFNPENKGLLEASLVANKPSLIKKMSLLLLSQNRWLKSLTVELKRKHLTRIGIWAMQNFDEDNYSEVFDILLPKVTYELLDRLEIYNNNFWSCNSSTLKLEILRKIVNDPQLSFDEARNLAEEKIMTKKARTGKIKKTLYKIFFIPILLFRIFTMFVRCLWFICCKIGEYAATLYGLYELFNKRCPYLTQPKVIKMED